MTNSVLSKSSHITIPWPNFCASPVQQSIHFCNAQKTQTRTGHTRDRKRLTLVSRCVHLTWNLDMTTRSNCRDIYWLPWNVPLPFPFHCVWIATVTLSWVVDLSGREIEKMNKWKKGGKNEGKETFLKLISIFDTYIWSYLKNIILINFLFSPSLF